MPNIGKCVTCGGEISPHVITQLGTKDGKHPTESKQWFFRFLTIYEPTYYLGDKKFCSATCCTKWVQENG